MMHTSLDITDNGIHINGTVITLPVSLNSLEALWGTPIGRTKKYNTIYTWNELGIYAYSADKKMIKGICFHLQKDKAYDFIPSTVYSGSITVNGKHFGDIPMSRNKKTDSLLLNVGTHQLFFGEDDDHTIVDIEVSVYEAPPALADPDKYAFKPIAGTKIKFTDFNFKLAVIQVLMYEKNLLQPVFDVYEFVERYKQREIDIDAEGYDIIPEVKEYFEKLEIDQTYSDEITELYQDGGNDIYMHVCPFWSGETDEFNIQEFDDADHFKNLRSMTLFYDKNIEQIKKDMFAKGIAVDPL